jgi:hypothetical protein
MVDMIAEAAQQSAETESSARKTAMAAFVCAVLPMFVSFGTTQSSSSRTVIDGRVVSESSRVVSLDYAALALGALAVLLGLAALIGAVRNTAASTRWRVGVGMIAFGGLGIGAWQAARGAGLL